jgi:hypothetical protein
VARRAPTPIRAALTLACLLVAGAAAGVSPAAAQTPFEWEPLLAAPGVVDLAGPRRDGRFVAATGDQLSVFRPGGRLQPFADGPGGYFNPLTGEPYIALVTRGRTGEPAARSSATRCVIAFGANGSSRAIAASGLPAGPDLGVESVGFVPKRFGRGDAAYLADFGVPGAAFPGTDAVLAATANELRQAGVRSGDLLVATEGGAETIRVRCGEGGACGVTQVGTGPDVTHAEGHIEFGPGP